MKIDNVYEVHLKSININNCDENDNIFKAIATNMIYH